MLDGDVEVDATGETAMRVSTDRVEASRRKP
jgi:hypothetical protein